MWNRARAALEARALGVSTNYSAWFGSGTASTAVLAPAQVAAIAPLVRVTAAYVVMYYAFCFFQSWSKLYLSASRRPSLFFSSTRAPAPRPWRGSLMRLLPWRSSRRWRTEFSIARSGLLRHHISRAPHTPSTRLTSAIAQEADSPAERRRQETDAHAAEVRQLWFK